MTRQGQVFVRRVIHGAALASLSYGSTVIVQAARAAGRRDLVTGDDADASGVEACGELDRPPLLLAALGDSTLTGPGLERHGDIWIRQVARWISARERVPVEVRSFAATGARVRSVLETQLASSLAFAPDIVVVAVGTNDAIHFTPLRHVESDFRRLVRSLVAAVPAVVIGGVGDLGGVARVRSPLATVLRARGNQVDRRIQAVTQELGVHYVDVSTVDGAFRHGGAQLFTTDLFHPNDLGHALWANTAAPVIGHAARRLRSP